MNIPVRLSLAFLTATILLSVSCASYPPVATSARNPSKTVAKVIAACGAAPVAFQDKSAAESITASIEGVDELKFALLLNNEGGALGRYFSPSFTDDHDQVVQAVSKQISTGELDFNLESLIIAIVPVKSGDSIIGYAAVGSL